MQIARIRQDGLEHVALRVAGERLALLDTPSVFDAADAAPGDRLIAVDDVETWLPPVPVPGKILGVAMNNSASNERKISAPEHPAFFIKPASCLVAHGEPIRIRAYYGSVHPEPELAVIIGRTLRDVEAIDALDYVFGYTVFNDITGNGMRADDLFHYRAIYASADGTSTEQREQHLSYAARYKGCDTFGCIGPWLTTADDVPDPDNLEVRCHVGGQLIAEDNTRFYNYKVAEILSYVSHYLTLERGDIISCGTAFKAGRPGRSIHQADLQTVAGPVDVHIEGLGTLSNPVVIENKPMGRWRLPTPNPPGRGAGE